MGIARRFLLFSLASSTLMALVGAGCGSSTGRAASTTSRDAGTTSTTSALAASLSKPGAHQLPDPPLTTPRTETTRYTQAGDSVLAWGAHRDTSPGARTNFIPIDVGALLEPHTATWTKLPKTPFDHPTAYPELAWSADRVVLIGNACVTAPTTSTTGGAGEHDSGNPDCPLGPVQAAVFDPTSFKWKAVTIPSSATGYVQQALAVGHQVLVVLSDQNSGRHTFALLDPAAATWTDVAPPSTGEPEVICASKGTAFAVDISLRSNGGPWSAAEDSNAGGGIDPIYGREQVSTLASGATAWSAPGPMGLSAGAPQNTVGCVGGGVVLVAAGNGTPGNDQHGAWFWQPGGDWAPVADAPPSPNPNMFSVGPTAASPLDHDQVSIDTTNAGSRVFDGATHQWSTLPALPDGATPLGVHLGSSELARTTNLNLVAITP